VILLQRGDPPAGRQAKDDERRIIRRKMNRRDDAAIISFLIQQVPTNLAREGIANLRRAIGDTKCAPDEPGLIAAIGDKVNVDALSAAMNIVELEFFVRTMSLEVWQRLQ